MYYVLNSKSGCNVSISPLLDCNDNAVDGVIIPSILAHVLLNSVTFGTLTVPVLSQAKGGGRH